jgi:ABC-type glycerol-3-phosphate transport system permease component
VNKGMNLSLSIKQIRHKYKYSKKKKLNRSVLGTLPLFFVLTLSGAFMILPIIFTVNNAFKPLDEFFIFPPKLFVKNPTTANFTDLILLMRDSWVPFTRYFFNTIFITVCGIIGHVLLASAAAYPLSKHKFKGAKVLFTIVILALMFTPQVTAIPNYIIMSKLGMIDTHFALILPAFALPLGLYLMKQFMEGIPDSILESAKIDGASEYTIYWKIVMPNVKPAWFTLIILQFIMLWGHDGWGFIYSEELKPLPFALGQIGEGGFARQGVQAAVLFLLMIVPVTLFIIVQSKIIETMANSGIKE